MPPYGVSLRNFYLPYGHIKEQVNSFQGSGDHSGLVRFWNLCSAFISWNLDHNVLFKI